MSLADAPPIILPRIPRPMGRPSGWTNTRIARLKELFDLGYSSSLIAADLGNCSRNAVIGKLHRIGLRQSQTSNVPVQPRKTKQSSKSRPRKPRAGGAMMLADAHKLDAEPELIDNVIPLGQRRVLLELTADTCKWPIGDVGTADFFFCGGQTKPCKPYCEYHCRIAYVPASSQRSVYIPLRSEKV